MDDFDKEGLNEEGKHTNGESFGHWLQTKYSEYVNAQVGQRMGVPSMADFADYLGIKNTDLSQYMNDRRRPILSNVEKMSDKLGPEVYDRLGIPRRMPRNKALHFVADNWSLMTEEEQREVVERVKNKVEARRAQRERRVNNRNAMA